jgi:hypothetical protein
MSSDSPSSRWGILTIAGACGLCCIALGAIAGGAAVTGGATAGVTAAGGVVTSLGGLLVVGLATALPLFVTGLVLRRWAKRSD